MNITKTIRIVPRLYTITTVIAKHGFGDIVSRLGLDTGWDAVRRTVTLGRVNPEAADEVLWEARVRLVLEDLGSTFIKFGQILATRPDLIPVSLVEELRKLQDNVPPFPSEVVRETVETELGAKITDLFASFEDAPLAAASIGQVHRAVLMSGDEVVVKIQRPGLDKLITGDLSLLHLIAELLEERIPEFRRWQPVAIVEEFDRSIHKEIDFGREAHNIRKFAKNFEGDPGVYAPRVYDDLCTERVLTMEFIRGVKMNAEEIATDESLDCEAIALTGVRAIITQIFVHGFFHADPHPGNVFVMPGNVICMLDFGMMGSLDQERIDDLLGFLVAVLTNNPERIVRQLQQQGLVDEHVDVRAMGADLADLMDRFLGVAVAKIDVAVYIQQLFAVITRHRVGLPADLLLMGKSLATIDGIARDICPELDPVSAIRAQILQIYFKRLRDPNFFTRGSRRALQDALFFVQRLPREAHLIVEKLRKGELTIKWEPNGAVYEQMVRDRTRASNRMAAAIAIVGLAAVSSFLLVETSDPLARLGQTTAGTVLFWVSIAGYGLASFLGLGFFWGMFRSGGQ